MIRGIVFDAFGTLFQVTNGASANTVRQRLEKVGVGLEESAFRRWWRDYYRKATAEGKAFRTERAIFYDRLDKTYRRFGVRRNAAEDMVDFWEGVLQRELYPEVREVLAELSKGHKLYIASNADTDILMKLLEKEDIHVDGVFTSENFRCYKPSAEFYNKLLESIPFPPEELLFLGDSLQEDVLSPMEYGMKAAWICREGTAEKGTCPVLSALPKSVDDFA